MRVRERTQELFESEQRFRDIFKRSPVGIAVYDLDDRLIEANEAYCGLLGYSVDELKNFAVGDITHPDDMDDYMRQLDELRDGRVSVFRKEVRLVRRDGEVVYVLSMGSLVRSEDGKPMHYLWQVLDITERKRSEEALRASEEKFRNVIENSNDAIYLLEGRRFELINRRFIDLFGITAEEARSPDFDFIDLVDPQSRPLIEDRMRVRERGGTPPSVYEFTGLRKDGRPIEVETNVSEITHGDRTWILGIIRDITEKKRIEEQLHRSMKMEAIGTLAAGVAHEINTPAQYVGGNLEFLEDAFGKLEGVLDAYTRLVEAVQKDETGGGDAVRVDDAPLDAGGIEMLRREIPPAIREAREGITRVTKIVQAMKELAHPGVQEMTEVDINRAIQSTITVSRNEWKYVADLETDLDPDLPPVPCMRHEFNQAILNIIVNAAHSIAEAGGGNGKTKGRITIGTRRDGDEVEIRISDTGTGIPEEIRTRIFDPFFTTKEVGKGTGQGLAIVHSAIVDKHGGTITFESREGVGTTFIIRLPLEKEESADVTES